jgi:hypothetical protein
VPHARLANAPRVTVGLVAAFHAAAAHYVAVPIRAVRLRAALDAGAAPRQAALAARRVLTLVVVRALVAETTHRVAGEGGVTALEVLIARKRAAASERLTALTRRACKN